MVRLRKDELMTTTILLGREMAGMGGIHTRPGRVRARVHLHANILLSVSREASVK